MINVADVTALAGLRVVSMAEQYPGPLCTLTLSDLGADVIQVERPGMGDPSRYLKTFYECLNRGKRSIALDVRQTDQRETLLSLLKDADVFLEGFRPGKLAKLGLGYDDVAAINPGIIYVSISGFGQDGPYRNRPAHDLSFIGAAGILAERLDGRVTGDMPSLALADTMAGLYATIGVLTALVGRGKTGRGSYVDIGMLDAVLALQAGFFALDAAEREAKPMADPGYQLYEAADGKWLTTSIANEDPNWDQLCRDVGLPEFAGLTRSDRIARRAELTGRIAAQIARHPRAHWEEIFEASGQMWGPANREEDLALDPQIAARGMIQQITRADGASHPVMRQPIRFSAWRNAPLTRAPALDEHRGQGFPQRRDDD